MPQSWSPKDHLLLFASNTGGSLDAWTGAINPGIDQYAVYSLDERAAAVVVAGWPDLFYVRPYFTVTVARIHG